MESSSSWPGTLDRRDREALIASSKADENYARFDFDIIHVQRPVIVDLPTLVLQIETPRIIAKSEIVVSTASMWAMVLKNAAGTLPLPQGSLVEQLEAQGFVVLPILPRHIEAVRSLDCPHADPFDRLLIAQARDEKLT